MIRIGITHKDNFFPNEHKVIMDCLSNGFHYFHIRKADFSMQQMEDYLLMFPKPVRDKLVLHSHFDLINKLGLAGAAANERNLNELTGVKVMSYSAHSIDELKYPPIEAKYYFLSPIWDSLSKKGYKATLNHDDIRAFLYRTDKEVIALGGVTDEKLGELIRMGFDGYAMLGNIWNDQYSFT